MFIYEVTYGKLKTPLKVNGNLKPHITKSGMSLDRTKLRRYGFPLVLNFVVKINFYNEGFKITINAQSYMYILLKL